MTSCYLRPLVYLGYGALGLGSLEPPVRTMVACYEWGSYLGEEGLKRGIKVLVSGFTRANSNAVMNKGKICGQYVTSVLAKRMAIKSGFEEALMLDPQGYVTEGTGENIFMVKHGVIRTPPTSTGDPRGHHARYDHPAAPRARRRGQRGGDRPRRALHRRRGVPHRHRRRDHAGARDRRSQDRPRRSGPRNAPTPGIVLL